jgi:hypothetical protein
MTPYVNAVAFAKRKAPRGRPWGILKNATTHVLTLYGHYHADTASYLKRQLHLKTVIPAQAGIQYMSKTLFSWMPDQVRHDKGKVHIS